MIEFKGMGFIVQSSAFCTRVYNSIRLKKRADIRAFLMLARYRLGLYEAVNQLNLDAMIREWRAHNLLHALGIARSRTRDVDLNENRWPVRAAYYVLSLIYWHR